MGTFRITLSSGRAFEITTPPEGLPTTQEVTPGPLSRFLQSGLADIGAFADITAPVGRELAETTALPAAAPTPPGGLLSAMEQAGITSAAARQRMDPASIAGRALNPLLIGAGTGGNLARLGAELAGGLGAAAGEIAGRAVGGDVGGLVGAVGGSLTPAGIAATTRRALGTPAGAARNLQLASELGTPLGISEVGGTELSRLIDRLSSHIPGGGMAARARATRLALRMQQRLGDIATELAGQARTPETGGRALQRGFGDFVTRFKVRGDGLYDNLRKQLTGIQIRPQATERALRELEQSVSASGEFARGFNPDVAGAIQDLSARFTQDLAVAPQFSGEMLDQIRRRIGDELGNPGIIGNPRQGVLKKLYDAVSEDLRNAAIRADTEARAAGAKPGALRAFERANGFWKSGRKRIASISKEVMSRETPSRILQALHTSGRSGPETIRAIRRSVSREHFDTAMGVVLHNMSLNQRGEPTLQAFLSNVDRFAKVGTFKVMFEGAAMQSRGIGRDLARIAEVAGGSEQLFKTLANPSQTAITGGSIATALGGGVAGAAGYLPEFLSYLAISGGGAFATQKMIASPRLVRWVAESTRIPVAQLPQHLEKLDKLKDDPEVRAFIENTSQNLRF